MPLTRRHKRGTEAKTPAFTVADYPQITPLSRCVGPGAMQS